MELGDRILVWILATYDAAFRPVRKVGCKFNRATVTYERRRDYSKQGVRWQSSAVCDSPVAAQRALDELVAKGLVVRARGKSKTVAVKLSDRGDAKTRRMCGLPTVKDSWHWLDQLTFDTWFGEVEYFGCTNWNDFDFTKLGVHQCEMQPLLSRGYANSCATGSGRVYYHRAGDTVCPVDVAGKEIPGHCYWELLMAEVRALDVAEPKDKNEIGIIPLCEVVKTGDSIHSSY